MKYLSAIVVILLSQFSQAGCLDSATASAFIVSKVKGLYVYGETEPQYAQSIYVLIDKNTCQLKGAQSTAIGTETKRVGYLVFPRSNKELYSLLLNAQTTGQSVAFNLLAPVGGYNPIGYGLLPAEAFTGILY